MFILYPFPKQNWKGINDDLQVDKLWEVTSIEECLMEWFRRANLRNIKRVPFLALWGIWKAQNDSIFEYFQKQSFVVTAHVLDLHNFFKEQDSVTKVRMQKDVKIVSSGSQCYFYEAYHGENKNYGLGV